MDNDDHVLVTLNLLCKDSEALGIDDLTDDFILIEEGSFMQDYKSQHAVEVIQHVASQRYFAIKNSRTGSYHTDWYYDTPSVIEVCPHTKTVTTWKHV